MSACNVPELPPEYVWVLLIDHPGGTIVHTFWEEGPARKQLHLYAEANWNLREGIPDDEDEAAEMFFADNEDRYAYILTREVIQDEPEDY